MTRRCRDHAHRTCRFGGGRRRASVLFAVLFLIALGAISATSMLTAIGAERAAVRRDLDEAHLRAGLRSGVEALLVEIGAQRDAMLLGEAPDLPDRITIERGEGQRAVVVELVPFRDGSLAMPDAARLDVNVAPRDALAGLPGLTGSRIDSIVAGRRVRPFDSPAAALRDRAGGGVSGDPASEAAAGGSGAGAGGPGGSSAEPAGSGLFGDAFPDFEEATESGPPGRGSAGSDPSGAALGGPPDSGADADFGGDGGDAGQPSAADLLTVFAADPQVQSGVAGDDFEGVERININAPWSDRLERAFEERASEPIAELARTLFIDSPRIETMGDLVGLLVEQQVPRESWGSLLDTLTVVPDPYRLGLVDINRAPRSVLAALPGMDDAAAAGLVSARDRLDPSDRRSVTWPLDEGVVEIGVFRGLVDVVTTRSLQWRVVLRAGFGEPDDGFASIDDLVPAGGLLPEADEFGVEVEAEAEPEGPGLTIEVVIDAAGATPRVAYLRETTGLRFAQTIATLPEFASRARSEDASDGGEAGGRGGVGTRGSPGPDESGGADGEDADEPSGLAGFGFDDPTLDGGPRDMDDGLDLAGSDPGGSGAGSGDGPGDGAGDGSGAGSARGGGGEDAGEGSSSGDNRIGRWAPARNAGGGGR